MATITIRNLDNKLKTMLRIQAASHDRSMEEEARLIIKGALCTPEEETGGLGSLIHQRFMAVDGIELTLPPRDQPVRKPGNLE